MTPRRLLAAALAVACLTSAVQAQVIYNNGIQYGGTATDFGFINGTGNGFMGANSSQIVVPSTTFGFGAGTPSVRIADDFTVPIGQSWTVNSITVFGYQTATYAFPPVSPFTLGNLRILDANPTGPFNVLAGDTTTNVQTSTSWTGAYRVTSTTLTNAQRPVMANVLTLAAPLVLGPGTYWIDFQQAGSLSANAFFPPISLLGNPNPGGNAVQSLDNGLVYAPLVNPAPNTVDMPFLIQGTVVPEPTSLVLVGIPVGGYLIRRFRKTTPTSAV